MDEKLEKLRGILRSMGSVVVAFSGGVDSTFLLKISHDELGGNVLAVTARSETYPEWECNEAVEFTKWLRIKHMVISSSELEIPEFRGNPPDRCYYCKKELFGKLKSIAEKEGFNFVIDGTNYDDLDDHRPGMRAVAELGVRSPLMEARLTKEDIRRLSKDMRLPTWDKPSFACFSSRFPYGTEITTQGLRKVSRAEKFLKDKGIRTIRVRHHGNLARIEVGTGEIPRFLEPGFRRELVDHFRELGYTYVTLDLQGYRTGSMNEAVPGLRTGREEIEEE